MANGNVISLAGIWSSTDLKIGVMMTGERSDDHQSYYNSSQRKHDYFHSNLSNSCLGISIKNKNANLMEKSGDQLSHLDSSSGNQIYSVHFEIFH